MRPHGPSLTEKFDPQRERAEIEREKCPTDVAAARATRHQHPEHDDPSGDRDILSPLARRYPRAGDQNDREDEAEGRGLNRCLPRKRKSDFDKIATARCYRMREQIIGAQQQRQAEAGDNGAAQSARLRRSKRPARGLRQQAGGEGQRNLLGTEAEIAEVRAGS